MTGSHDSDNWEWFKSQSTIHPVTDDSSPSNSSPPSRRTPRHRPPTPPFPNSIPFPVPNPDPEDCRKNSPKSTRTSRSRTNEKTGQQAYADFLSYLRNAASKSNALKSGARPNRSDADVLHTLLRLLSRETARADAAERGMTKEASTLLARVKDAKESKAKLEAELSRVKTELELYKLQLEIAQREIYRAQAIVDEVEHARARAEDQGIRDRDNMRRMINQRALEQAIEEGRRQGWRQGLERGRWLARTTKGTPKQHRMHEQNADMSDQSPSHSQTSLSTKSSSRTSESNQGIRSETTAQPAFPYTQAATMSNIATTTPLSHSSSHSLNPSEGTSRSPGETFTQPSVSTHTHSPSISRSLLFEGHPQQSPAPSHRSHRSFVLPPEGYIPTLGPDAHISLPPPHELSQAVSFDEPAATIPSPPQIICERMGKTNEDNEITHGKSKQMVGNTDDRSSKVSTTLNDPILEHEYVFMSSGKGKRHTPAGSPVSTSQYDLTSPSRVRESKKNLYRKGGRRSAGRGEDGASPARSSECGLQEETNTREYTQPHHIIDEFKSTNSDVVRTLAPISIDPIAEGKAEIAGTSIHSERSDHR